MAIEAVEAEAVREQNAKLAPPPLCPSAPVFQSRRARRRTKMAKCVILSRHFGLVSSAEPMPHIAAKRCPTIARTAPMTGDALG
jgi:hypothetical protein